jgi:hypothetical protein
MPTDRIAENNARAFSIDNREKTYRILYVSGRPNWQNKFFRMALEGDDKQLHLTSLIAISNAERKFEFRGRKSTLSNPLFEGFENEEDRPRYDEAVFIRMGAGKDELTSGFPADAKDLFAYDLVIFGDVERPFFTMTQLDITRDFVDRRGGTLLLLGGPRSFTEGGYAGTVIEKMMPLLLYQDGTEASRLAARRRRACPCSRCSATARAGAQYWPPGTRGSGKCARSQATTGMRDSGGRSCATS